MPYIDLAVMAVPTKNKEIYQEHATQAGKIFKEQGALSAGEYWGDEIPEGKTNSLRTAVQLKEGETVCFSMLVWPSKEVRNEAMPKAMQKMGSLGKSMPFDGSRLIYGSFEQIVGD